MADKTSIMKEAQKYLAKGQIDKAISEFEKIVNDSPDGNAYNTIGDLYLKKGDKKNAIDSYHKAANFFRHEGFSLKALALYKKVLNINPSEIEALHSLGDLSEEKGLTTDAIKYYLASADSMVKAGKKDRVLDVYEKILSLSPSNIPLRNKVAEIFLKEGLKSDATKEYIYIARLYDEKGDIQKSREYYNKVIDLQPLNKEAFIGISYLYEKTGELDNAVEHMKEAAALFPGETDIMLRCAELSLIRGDADGAKEYLNRIIEQDPTNLKSRRLLGELYLQDGLKEKAWVEYLPVLDDMILEEKYESAIKLLETFKKVDPLETGKRLVSLYRQIGENDRVAAELVSLGDALSEKGLSNDALSCYREALDITPDDQDLKGKIAEITQAEEKEEAEREGLEGTEIEERAAPEHISIKGEKTVDEIFTEADIFSRYGLVSEAKRLLEGLKHKQPENIDLHMRLKSVYLDTADKEEFVTECLILSKLFRRLGDADNADRMLKDAYEIYPEDPRLTERFESLLESTHYAAAGSEEPAATSEPAIEDYEEEIAEADFYARQGLIQEAAKIFENLHRIFPDNKEISERLGNLGQVSEVSETEEITGPSEIHAETFDDIEKEPVSTAAPSAKDELAGRAEEEKYEDFIFTEQDLVEAQEIPEPALDNDVLEIFQEFKKGLEKELEDEDSETHYNLGIAYKEMGLVDDAIKEFQTARKDPKRFIQSSTMLGVCYMEKGLYSLAIDALNTAVKDVGEKNESYWAIKYDLAEAYEKNNNLKEALNLFTDVYGWNARFRNVSEKVSQVRAQLAKGGEQEKPKGRKDRVSYL
ncbi:MAG: tetratricopeptide repeat protein [Nitrospirota bacterium]